MFYVGQKVVCVDDGNRPGKRWLPHQGKPVKGAIYTIARSNFISPISGREQIELVEIKCNWHNISNGYGTWRFRPVTDISTLQAIVAEVKTGKPRKIEADRFDKQRVSR